MPSNIDIDIWKFNWKACRGLLVQIIKITHKIIKQEAKNITLQEKKENAVG